MTGTPDFDQPWRRQKNLAVTIVVVLAVLAGAVLIWSVVP